MNVRSWGIGLFVTLAIAGGLGLAVVPIVRAEDNVELICFVRSERTQRWENRSEYTIDFREQTVLRRFYHFGELLETTKHSITSVDEYAVKTEARASRDGVGSTVILTFDRDGGQLSREVIPDDRNLPTLTNQADCRLSTPLF